MELIRHTSFKNQFEGFGHLLVNNSREGYALLVNFSAVAVAAKRLESYLMDLDMRGINSLLTWGGDVRLAFPPDITIQNNQTILPECGLRNVTIAHPGFAAKGLVEQVYLYSLDSQMPAGFVYRIQHAINVPVKNEWERAVWHVLTHPNSFGLEDYEVPLHPLFCLGSGLAWEIITDDQPWLDVLRIAIPLSRREEPWPGTEVNAS